MGRRSIPIEEIKEDRRRQVTFQKRKTGLFKKAMELSILCKSKILLVVFDDGDVLHEYSSNEDPRPILKKYFDVSHDNHASVCNDDYDNLFGSKNSDKKTLVKKVLPQRANPRMENPMKSDVKNEEFTQLPSHAIPDARHHPVIPTRYTDLPLDKQIRSRNRNTSAGVENEQKSFVKRTKSFRNTGFTPLPRSRESFPFPLPTPSSVNVRDTGFTPLPYPSHHDELRENSLLSGITNGKKRGYPHPMNRMTQGSIKPQMRKSIEIKPQMSSRFPLPHAQNLMMNQERRDRANRGLKIDVGETKRIPIEQTNVDVEIGEITPPRRKSFDLIESPLITTTLFGGVGGESVDEGKERL